MLILWISYSILVLLIFTLSLFSIYLFIAFRKMRRDVNNVLGSLMSFYKLIKQVHDSSLKMNEAGVTVEKSIIKTLCEHKDHIILIENVMRAIAKQPFDQYKIDDVEYLGDTFNENIDN